MMAYTFDWNASGLQDNRLAVVSDKALPWTILRVVKTKMDMRSKAVKSPAFTFTTNGQKVSFLEFN